MDNIKIQGGQMHITQDNTTVYEVLEGHVLVYLFPYADGKPGRRQLIAEMTEHELIPGFAKDDELLGTWRLGLVALDEAVIQICQNKQDDTIKEKFASRIWIKWLGTDDYEEQLIEKYNINIIKEEGYIYATAQEQKSTYKKSLKIIFDLFQGKKERHTTPESGNRIYDGVAYLCDRVHIPIADFDKIQESCGRRFTVADIARISHFITREVVLEPKWYLRDSGPILAYRKDGHQPIACVPMGPKRYMAYDAQKQTDCIIDEEYAEQLDVKADMLYRPFPNKEMKAKDLFAFGMRSVYKSDIVRFILLAFVGTLVGLLMPLMNEQLYDKFIPMGNKNGLIQICCVILACTIGNVTFTIVKNLAAFRSMNAMEYAVQSATYDRLFNLPESFFRKYDSAELAQRAMGISQIYNALADVAIKTVLSAVFSLLYLLRMFQYSKKLTGVSMLMLIVCMIIIAWIGVLQTKYESQKMELDSKTSSVMYQFLNGISKIRIAGVENRALYEYLKPYTQSRSINIRKEKMTVGVNTLVGAMNTVFSIVLYYIMIKNNMTLSVGAFMGFSSAFGSLSGSMLEIVSSLLQVNSIKPAYDRCKPILQTLPEFDEDTVMPGALTGDIEVNNVTFSYDETSGVILNNVSMHINAGEYIGIVGSSGSGKSTLLKLLLGFEKPDVGKIYYDGKDIDSMDKRELRKKFGVVLQDGKLISGSIFENITITAPGTKLEQVKKVVKAVGLEDDINQMPMGLHTVLSEDSGTISGGQQQRILIARAIVGNPKIIYFDEATSALDNVTQAMVCESLERLKATRVVIAHRLSTVMNCDRIFVLEKGNVVEEGSYQQLMDMRGRFYDLAVRQL
jgi:ATP-binding cassette subfamily C protein